MRHHAWLHRTYHISIVQYMNLNWNVIHDADETIWHATSCNTQSFRMTWDAPVKCNMQSSQFHDLNCDMWNPVQSNDVRCMWTKCRTVYSVGMAWHKINAITTSVVPPPTVGAPLFHYNWPQGTAKQIKVRGIVKGLSWVNWWYWCMKDLKNMPW